MHELDLGAAAARTVADVMISHPKSLAADATVADARALFANPRVQVCPVIGQDGRLAGALRREALPESAAGHEPALGYVGSTPATIAPDARMTTALETLAALDSERLMVVDGEGRLTGMLCLNRRNGHFCVDR
jgi:CBS domain-containing protein